MPAAASLKTPLLALCLALSACGGGAPAGRYLIAPPGALPRLSVPVSTVELRDVDLPEYAAASDMLIEAEGGALLPLENATWADDPVRAATLTLARALDAASTAQVAAEPWPLSEPAQVRVEVRIEEMVAQRDGTFRLAGQYALAAPDGAVRERLERFEIRQPMTSADAAGLASATAAAIAQLGQQIARDLRR